MKSFWTVSFQTKNGIFCSNLVHAEFLADIDKHYSKYPWHVAQIADDSEYKIAQKKGKPIIEL
jgi:hypothetical protein